jgi:microcystin-dependent protein
MPLETGSDIGSLNASNPVAGDGLGQADDHIRLIKTVLTTTFPNFDGVLEASQDEIDTAVTATNTDGVGLLDTDGAFFAGDTDTGISHSAANKVGLKAGGTTRVEATSTGAEVTGTLSASGAISGGTGQLVPVGTVLDYAGTTEPTGYLFCYGQAVSRTTYADLFTAIGTTYGVGDGSTTFNLPDLRGRVIAGQDDMGGTSADRLTAQTGGVNGDTLGAAGGAETHTLLKAQLPTDAPTGTVSAPTLTAFQRASVDTDAGARTILVSAVGDSTGTSTTAVTSSTPTFTGAALGSGEAHNIVQPTLVLNKIIKH